MWDSLSEVEAQGTSWMDQTLVCHDLPVPVSGPTKETPGHCEIYNISSDDKLNIRFQFKDSI